MLTIPRIISRPPDNQLRAFGDKLIRIVLTLSSRVKKIIDNDRAPPIMYGRARSLVLLPIEPPIITGNTGSTQGAKMVKMPATRLISKSNISKHYRPHPPIIMI